MSDIFNPSYPTYFGFELMPSSSNSTTLNSSTAVWSGAYRPTVSKTVTSLQILHWSHAGTFQSLNVSLCSDNGGKPGTILQVGTVTPTADFTWESVAITSQAITAGTLYWITVNVPLASGTNSIDMREINDPDSLIVGVANRFTMASSTNAGVAWTVSTTFMGCVGVGYSDSTFEGCGYGDFDTFNINNTNDQWGEYFQVPSNMTVNAFSHKTFKSAAGTPTAPLTYVLMNADTATTLASGTLVTAAAVTTTATWYTATFSNISLVTGTNYRVYVTSAATASPQYTFLPAKTVNNGNSNAMTFGGTTDVLAENNSGSYSTDATREFPFRLSLTTATAKSFATLMLMGV